MIAVSEKVIVRLDDLVKWTVPDFSGWPNCLKAEPLKPSVLRELGTNGRREALHRYRETTSTSGLNFKDVQREKAQLGELAASGADLQNQQKKNHKTCKKNKNTSGCFKESLIAQGYDGVFNFSRVPPSNVYASVSCRRHKSAAYLLSFGWFNKCYLDCGNSSACRWKSSLI